jgi:DNA adenine methylase
MPITDTPLRYPGGKTQLAPFVTELMRANDLLQSVYCEPFAGGAGIACRLLLNGTVSEAWINDLDSAIYAFWHSVLNSTEALCDRIASTRIDMTEWYRQRVVQRSSSASILDIGFSTLFLNRTNRSGILRGGVIGGKDQKGNYPLDCRFDRVDLVRKIRRIALYRDQIHLSCIDARLYISSALKKLPAHALVNVDPPYYRAGPDLYTNSYVHKDHVALARAVQGMPHRWMLTYDDAPEIRALYAGLTQYRKELIYYAQVKRSAAELLVLSPRLAPTPSLAIAEPGAA